MLFVDVRSRLPEASQEQLNISSECNIVDTFCDGNGFWIDNFCYEKWNSDENWWWLLWDGREGIAKRGPESDQRELPEHRGAW